MDLFSRIGVSGLRWRYVQLKKEDLGLPPPPLLLLLLLLWHIFLYFHCI